MDCPHHEKIPYKTYAALISTFSVISAGGVARAREGKAFSLEDLLLFGLSTHKLTNLIATDRVTAVLRAPLTEQEEEEGELVERPRAESGPIRALAELLTCQYCLGPWVATALLGAHAAKPQWTRGMLEIFSVVAVSDLLHHVSASLQR